jgi:hypothetical protein
VLTREERDRLSDYFDPWELCELLKVRMDDFLEAFEGDIEEMIEELNEVMGVSDDDIDNG